MNAHDLARIKDVVDPSYEARTATGVVALDHSKVLDAATWLFEKHPDYRESLEIDDVSVVEDTARLTTTRTEEFKGLFGMPRRHRARQVETWRNKDGPRLIVSEQEVPVPGGEGPGGFLPWWLWAWWSS